jgi:hypothetical protein
MLLAETASNGPITVADDTLECAVVLAETASDLAGVRSWGVKLPQHGSLNKAQQLVHANRHT